MEVNSKNKIYSVGYVPKTFPRDPVEINQFLEHMFVGQVIEPLVDSDKYGQVVGGVGKAWTFENSGAEIRFIIDTSKKFSNGRSVNEEDVVYSIGRHLKSKSQSSQFLADVESIEVSGPGRVVVKLNKANVAVIKALSRDQLGILPKGWTFNPESDEPYIGTGPYRLIREKGEWRLVANRYYSKPEEVKVKSWVVRFLDLSLNAIPEGPLPDFIPTVTGVSIDKIKSKPEFSSDHFSILPNLNYSQTSFWIFPTSDYFKNTNDRLNFASLFGEMIEKYVSQKKYERATGLIPLGILGHNPGRTELQKTSNGKVGKTLRIANLKGVFEDLFGSAAFKEFVKVNNLKIELIPFDPPMLYELKEKNIDIITGSWAGGFSDPTGFLGLLTPLLGMGFDTYLGDIVRDLEAAKGESDWQKRAEKFKKFDSRLVASGLMIPGWRVPTYSVIKQPLKYSEIQSRYTERFINVSDR